MAALLEEERPAPTACHFWLKAKNRHCKVQPGKGAAFCKVHDSAESRVPCPVDPTHSVDASKVEAHVKICFAGRRAAELVSQPWYSAGVNAGGDGFVGGSSEARPVEELMMAVLDAAGEDPPDHVDAASPTTTRRSRDELQGALILGELRSATPIEGSCVFVDLGAGKGGLGASCRKENPSAGVLLVERASRRHKRDPTSGNVERLSCDLGDIHLGRVESLTGADVFGVAKHLCGAATDLALRALLLPGGFRVQGLAIATCCHHACSWADYVGRDFFRTSLGCSEAAAAAEFAQVSKWSSWATGAARAAALEQHQQPDVDVDESLPLLRRLAVGRASKRLIDHGRLDYLSRQGFEAQRKTYCEPSLSPENNLILATPKIPKGQEEAS